MKKHILFLVTILICLQNVFAQYVEIPDTALQNTFKTYFPDCINQNMEVDTVCLSTQKLNSFSIYSNNVKDITGIQYLKNVTDLDIANLNTLEVNVFPPNLKFLKCYGNIKLNNLPETLYMLAYHDNSLYSLPKLPKNLDYLDCSNSSLTFLPELPENLNALICNDNLLSILPNLPPNLVGLNCSGNPNLVCLPYLPSKLVDIVFDTNRIKCLPNRLYNIFYFPFQNYPICNASYNPNNCDYVKDSANFEVINDYGFGYAINHNAPACFDKYNRIDTTCTLLSQESVLTITFDETGNSGYPVKIKDLKCLKYYKNLTYLDCSNNDIRSLPKLPNKLYYLDCSNNPNLNCLPYLPQTLQNLYFDTTNIKCIPNIVPLNNISDKKFTLCSQENNPNNCNFVSDSANFIVVKDANFGAYLLSYYPSCFDKKGRLDTTCTKIQNEMELYVPGLHISKIDEIKYFKKLITLFCSDNEIAEIKELPPRLGRFYCDSNKLSYLPKLPEQLGEFGCFKNPNLKCLPVLPKNLINLYINPNEIKCIPNRPSELVVANENNSIIFENFPLCDPSNNSDKCQAFGNIKGKVYVDLNKNGNIDSSEIGLKGVKIFLTPSIFTITDINGNYSFSPDTLGNYKLFVEKPNHYNILTDSIMINVTTYDSSFVGNLALEIADSTQDLSLQIIPLRASRPGFELKYLVKYENLGTQTVVPLFTFDYDSTVLKIDSVSTLYNKVSDSKFDISLPIKLGKEESFIIYTRVSETAPLGNLLKVKGTIETSNFSKIDSSSSTITGSFDPNDKQATSNLKPSQLQNGEFIDYTIRFQNTGTDTAFTVVIKDTLSQLLKANTLEILASSHNCKTTITNNIVNFRFDNILLPDSNRNEAGSHGFVRFKVQPNSSVKEEDIIENKAYIYFDYNLPVITNTASTTFIENVTGLFDTYISNNSNIYPNPAKDKITVVANGSELLSIYNAMGNLVHQQTVHRTQEIDINDLTSGLYLYNLGAKRGKLVIK